MAKNGKKKKDKKGSGASDAVEAVRSAVERTLHATTEGSGGASKRTRQLVDEVAGYAARIKETLEDIKNLRGEIESLSRRVSALENAVKPAAGAARTTAARKPAASRAKTTGTRSTAAKKPASTRSRSTTTRSRSTRSSGGSSGTS